MSRVSRVSRRKALHIDSFSRTIFHMDISHSQFYLLPLSLLAFKEPGGRNITGTQTVMVACSNVAS